MKHGELIFPGTLVVCTDNENVEALVQKNMSYMVNEVSHRGALLKLQGISATLASTRFVPANLLPPTMEVSNASG